MILLVSCLRRHPHLSAADFLVHWHEVHGELVRLHADVLGIRMYVQLHPNAAVVSTSFRLSEPTQEPFDGVALATWDSFERYSAESPAAAAARAQIATDAALFIDSARSPWWFADPVTLIGNPDRWTDR